MLIGFFLDFFLRAFFQILSSSKSVFLRLPANFFINDFLVSGAAEIIAKGFPFLVIVIYPSYSSLQLVKVAIVD